MKRVTRCYNCKRIIKRAGSFNARLENAELQNGVMVQDINLCRICSFEAGYKVKGFGQGLPESTLV